MTQSATEPDRNLFLHAAPFWAALGLIPLAVFVALLGGWWILLIPAVSWVLFSGLDAALGRDETNLSPETPDAALFWHNLVLRIWPYMQGGLLIFVVAYAPSAEHLNALERIVLFFGVGVVTGTVGITFAHELMHRPGRYERFLGDVLMAMTLYGHFRSEHLQVHHRHVGTPRDAVSARYSEGFPRFFIRVLPESLMSAWQAERDMLARKDLPWWNRANPFWRYAILQLGFLVTALILGGWSGLALFLYQAFIAIWQLELVNYVEHYGLQRKHLGDGKYEPVKAHHSWNATHKASNWLLINLQRHSDHHIKPSRPFPLLQSLDEEQAPELPYGYPVMTMLAMIPPVWRRVMNPRVRAWRTKYYPEIEDWRAQSP